MTGGTEEGYYLVLSAFSEDAQERIKKLKDMLEEDTLSKFIVSIHALKSAAASIGATELSAEAARLESAGKCEDTAYINNNLKKFTMQLAKTIEGINSFLETINTGGG